jgi:hypothetical protein
MFSGVKVAIVADPTLVQGRVIVDAYRPELAVHRR